MNKFDLAFKEWFEERCKARLRFGLAVESRSALISAFYDGMKLGAKLTGAEFDAITLQHKLSVMRGEETAHES